MEIIYFTVTAIFLYLISDMILNKIEKIRGERLKSRSLIFFAIILVLSLISFNLIEYVMRWLIDDQELFTAENGQKNNNINGLKQ